MCLGFHAGWIWGLTGNGPFDYWNIIMNGAFYSATSWIIHQIVTRIEGDTNDSL